MKADEQQNTAMSRNGGALREVVGRKGIGGGSQRVVRGGEVGRRRLRMTMSEWKRWKIDGFGWD